MVQRIVVIVYTGGAKNSRDSLYWW
jgi:hypothetical protein